VATLLDRDKGRLRFLGNQLGMFCVDALGAVECIALCRPAPIRLNEVILEVDCRRIVLPAFVLQDVAGLNIEQGDSAMNVAAFSAGAKLMAANPPMLPS
jgi:hypothetical protein